MPKRKLTPAYIIFYVLFLPDSWRILFGVIAAVILTPAVVKPEMTDAGRVVLFLMLTAIGYAASRWPANRITRLLKKLIIGDRRP